MALDAGVWARRGHGASGLRKLLKGWCFAINKYSEEMDGKDGAYIYNERANVSMLAAGAWLQDGVALEEYSSPKTKNDLPSNGRCDLYVYIGGENYEIEAKALTSRMPLRQDLFEKKVGGRLDQALKDAERLPVTAGIMRVGCVFFILRLKASKRSPTTKLVPQYEQELMRYQKFLKQSENCDAFAWCLPPSARRLRTGGVIDDFAFGAIVAMKLSGPT